MFENITRGKGVSSEQLIEFICIERDGERVKKFISERIGTF